MTADITVSFASTAWFHHLSERELTQQCYRRERPICNLAATSLQEAVTSFLSFFWNFPPLPPPSLAHTFPSAKVERTQADSLQNQDGWSTYQRAFRYFHIGFGFDVFLVASLSACRAAGETGALGAAL